MLCYSTGSLPQVSFSEIVKILKPTPFKGVEIVITPALLSKSHDHPFWESTRELFKDNGFEIRNLHLGAPHLMSKKAHEPGIASPVLKERKEKLAGVTRCIQIATILKSPAVTITTGLPNPASDLSQQTQWLHQAIESLLKITPPQMKLGLEQEPEHIIHSTSQLKDLCSRFEQKLFLTFDIGHSQVLGENIAECIEELFPYIINLHFEDIRGNIHQHKLFGEGDINFQPIFNKLKILNYQGDFTPDLYPFAENYQSALQSAENFFKQMEINA